MTAYAERAAPGRSFVAEVVDVVKTVGFALVAALVLRVVLFQPFTIPSSSMEPGLVTGDYILVSKFSYGWSRAAVAFNPPLGDGRLVGRTADRRDVVVFRAVDDLNKTLIKRVIGRPGDRVQVRGGRVWVNGRAIASRPLGLADDRDAGIRVLARQEQVGPRTWRTFDRGPGREGDDTGVYLVPAGQYFVMGDNRDNSLDSRWPVGLGVGFIPAETLLGEAQWVLLSWKPGASVLKPWTWLNLQTDRFLKPIR